MKEWLARAMRLPLGMRPVRFIVVGAINTVLVYAIYAAMLFAGLHYALANLLYHPVPGVLFGPEVQWGKRENYRDGFTSDDLRIQFSAKYNFNLSVGGKG